MSRPTTEGGGLARSTTLYGASNVLQRVIPILILPVLARFLTPADFGLMAIFASVVSIVTPFVGLNAPFSIRRRYFEANEEKDDFPAYVANCLGILLLGTFLTSLVALALGPSVQALTGLPRAWTLAAVPLGAAQVLLTILLTIWQVRHQAGRYAGLQVSRAAGNTGLTLWFVVGLGLGWEGALTATLTTTGLFAVAAGVPGLRRWVNFRYDAALARHAARYGSGLIPHTLGMLAIMSTDRFFVSHYAGNSETGLYWLGYQFGFAVAIVADSFNRAFSPWLFESLSKNDPALDRRAVRMTYGYFVSIGLFAALVIAVAPFIVTSVLPREYAGAGDFVWWITVGFALNGMYRVVAGYVFYVGRTSVLSAITGFSAVANFGLNYWLVPRFGAIGAAQATAAVFLLSFVLTWLAAARLHRMPWTLKHR